MPEKKAWYKKKRYIFSLGLLAVIILASDGNSSKTAVQQSYVSAPQAEVQTEVNRFNTPESKPLVNSQGLSNDNYYTNVNGNKVHSPAYSQSVPANATAECRDGTYSFSQNRRGTCSHHGGVSRWLD